MGPLKITELTNDKGYPFQSRNGGLGDKSMKIFYILLICLFGLHGTAAFAALLQPDTKLENHDNKAVETPFSLGGNCNSLDSLDRDNIETHLKNDSRADFITFCKLGQDEYCSDFTELVGSIGALLE